MNGHLQLHENITYLKNKNRYTNNHISDALGYSKGVFEVKMSRLKKGNATVITVRDVARLIRLFECTANELLKDVEF